MNAKEETPPLFIVRIMKNASGQLGPILCWPDGEIVPGQCDTGLRLPAEGLATVTVCLFVGTGVVELVDQVRERSPFEVVNPGIPARFPQKNTTPP